MLPLVLQLLGAVSGPEKKRGCPYDITYDMLGTFLQLTALQCEDKDHNSILTTPKLVASFYSEGVVDKRSNTTGDVVEILASLCLIINQLKWGRCVQVAPIYVEGCYRFVPTESCHPCQK